MKKILLSAIFVFLLSGCSLLDSDVLSKNELLNLKKQCAEDGKKFHQEYTGGESFNIVRYLYSEKLNTCLVYSKYLKEPKHEVIIDIYTNQELAYYEINSPIGLSKDSFDNKKKKLGFLN